VRSLLHILCGLLLFVGCGRRHDLTIHVGGTSTEIATWENIAADFETETGIHVELLRSTSQTEQRKQSILVALRARQSDPDVLLLDVAWIAQIAASGWLEPLAGLDSTLFFSSVFDHADRWDGTIIGAPVYVDGGILYYRSDLLAKYGAGQPPTTWQELERISLAAMHGERPEHADFWGYVWQGAEYEGLVCNALEVFSSAGGGFFDDQQQPILDAPQNVTALERMVDWIHGSRISPPSTYTDMHEDEVRLVFQNGDALFEPRTRLPILPCAAVLGWPRCRTFRVVRAHPPSAAGMRRSRASPTGNTTHDDSSTT
jgi:trehalose/maltose transport system substrate-binding protein